MQQFILILAVLNTALWAQGASKDNWRCWADPGFAGVIKIDAENNLVCSTGYNGVDYECKGNPRLMKLISTSSTEAVVNNQTLPAVKFLAASENGTEQMELTLISLEFPRPYFPQHMVSPANIQINTGLFGYPSSTWSRPFDGKFQDGELYCLSERYFTTKK